MQRPEFAQGPTVKVDLKAGCQNFDILKNAAGSDVAAVVKCDGYGLGATPFVRTLFLEKNCRHFFVAHPEEGALIRNELADLAPDVEILIFNGPTQAALNLFTTYNLVPVINSVEQGQLWADSFAQRPCALHIDTGMNRLGVRIENVEAINSIKALKVSMIMSHFACADQPGNEMNKVQRTKFDYVRAQFPEARTSLANTGGAFLDENLECDLARIGIGLYGISTFDKPDPRLKTVASFSAPILQISQAKAGETIGYGQTHQLEYDSTLAAAAIGYGDGYMRSAGNHAAGWINGHICPVVGRVSMDSVVFDITDVQEKLSIGDAIELFGHNMPIESVASACGTIGYELLTGLGRRVNRQYLWGDLPARKELVERKMDLNIRMDLA